MLPLILLTQMLVELETLSIKPLLLQHEPLLGQLKPGFLLLRLVSEIDAALAALATDSGFGQPIEEVSAVVNAELAHLRLVSTGSVPNEVAA